MMKKLLKILEITLWIVLSGGLMTLFGFAYIEHDSVRCRDFSIDIEYGNADTLVTKENIYTIIKQTGNLLKGQRIGYIDAEKIESSIRRQPYVSYANVFVTIDGFTKIDVVQRQPVVRIFNQRNESFYLDGSGQLLPLNPDFSARVLIANGHIREPFSRTANYMQDSIYVQDSVHYNSVMNNLFRLATFIISDPLLKALIEEVYVEKNGEFELIPKVGDQIILFGNAENMKDKFDRLLLFYRKGLNIAGWNKYNVINIKYKNQVVCSKI